MSAPFVWQGRIDTEEVGDSRRWHQCVQPFTPQSRSGVALIGFAVDEGVRRNGGRAGAAQGPAAARKALANLPILGEPALWDAGDAVCEGDALDAAQTALAQRRPWRRAARPWCWAVVEVAWGTFQGVALARPGARILIVNLDAHFDLRQAREGNSGTPFRQIQEHCARGLPFDYRVLGISRFANTQALFDRADALQVRYVLDDALQTEAGVHAALADLAPDLQACDVPCT